MNIYYVDSTEQKKQEDIQIELLDNLPCGAALFEVKGSKLSIIHLNRHYWELVRRKPLKVEDIDIKQSVHPDDCHLIDEEIEAALCHKRDAACNIRIADGHGSYQLFHVSGRFVEQNNGRRILCAAFYLYGNTAIKTQELLPVVLGAIMESTSDLSFVKTSDLRYLCSSNAFAKMVGYGSGKEIVGKSDYDLFSPEIAEKYRQDDESLLKTGRAIIDFIENLPAEDGTPRYSRTSKYLLKDGTGSVVGLYGVGRDVTAELAMTEKLRISEEAYRLATQHTGSTVCRFDVAGRILTMPPEVAQKRGLPQQIENMPDSILNMGIIMPENEKTYRSFYQQIIDGAKTGSMVFQLKTQKGVCWQEEHFSTIFSNGKPKFAVISYSDVTERQEQQLLSKKWQQSLHDKNPADYTLFRCNISHFSATDTQQGGLLSINMNLEKQTFNQGTAEYAGRFVYEPDRTAYIALLNSDTLLAGYYRNNRYWTMEYREIVSAQEFRWLKLTVELVEYPNSSDVEAYLMYENIDQEKKAALQIKEHAETDALTGILNRSAFAEKMDLRLNQRAADKLCALLILDLDDFKRLNDQYGHMVGDNALVEVGQRLQASLRPFDLVGRLGGDEFIVFISDLPDIDVIDRRAKVICDMISPVFECGVYLSASVGIAVSPDDGNDFAILYQKADIALYRAKRAGKNHHAFFGQDNDKFADE